MRSAHPTREAAQTTVHVQRFAVAYEYPVYFTERLFDPANPVLREVVTRLEADRRHRCLMFVDDGLLEARPGLADEVEAYFRHHGAALALVAPPIAVPGGEQVKNELFFVEQMQRQVFEHAIDRHSYVIAVGGGALLDAVGLVAATTHRGVRLIRVPTTVLAQDDSGVGVKNGVNLYGVKNFCGSFAPPFAVLNDIDLLTPLSQRDKIAGMAEAVKVALIRDGDFFAWLERNADDLITFERPALAAMIRRCAELHMRQIAHGGDPFETGSARPLDYGHWSAHKLESLTKHHCATARRSRSASRSTPAIRCWRACSPQVRTSASARSSSTWAFACGIPRSRRDAPTAAWRFSRGCGSFASTSAASSR